MGTPRIVITGIGILSPLGKSLSELKGGMAQRPAPVASTASEFHTFDREISSIRICDYDPAAVLGKAGLRTKDWATKVLLGAVELGFKDVLASFPEETRPGLCVGTAFGSVQSIGDFLSDSIVNGVNNVNPQAFANTVINAPTSNANIRHMVRTLSSTIGTGFNAGADALVYSRDYLARGYLGAIVAGGVEEISYYATAGLLRSGVLSPSNRIRPFAADSDGYIMGEGCGLMLLETEESAKARGATAIAEIAGVGMAFDPATCGGYNPTAEGARRAVKDACAMAGIPASAIGFVAASANGNPSGDAMEAVVIRELFPGTPVAAYKSKTGECYGASPAISAVLAAADLVFGRVSGTGQTYATMPGVNLVAEETPLNAEYALVNAFSCDGNCTSLVIRRAS